MSYKEELVLQYWKGFITGYLLGTLTLLIVYFI